MALLPVILISGGWKGLLVLLLMATLPTLAILLIFFLNYSQWLQRAARNWPSAQATVENFRTYRLEEEPRGWALLLNYSYRLGADLYSGWFQLPGAWPSKQDAEAAGVEWKGYPLPIHYNADHPERSVFLEVDGAPLGGRNYFNRPPVFRDNPEDQAGRDASVT